MRQKGVITSNVVVVVGEEKGVDETVDTKASLLSYV
jgi:hypothetical protein